MRYSSVVHERRYQESISSSSLYADQAGLGGENHLQRMADLHEGRVLLRALFWFGVPVSVFGVAAMLFPVAYMMMPVQESASCICSFY